MAGDKQKAPAYQWYPKDYDTDEAVKLMTYEQEGIYRRLLDHQALHGSIPADPKDIAMLVPKISAAKFLTLWPRIAGKFSTLGDRLVNLKLERVKAGTGEFKADKSAAGKASVDARRAKFGSAQPVGSPNTSPNRTPNRTSNTARTDTRTDDQTAAEPASASASANTIDRSDQVFDRFRARWKTAYGYECSLIPNALTQMQLDQQVARHEVGLLLRAVDAFFEADDPFLTRAKHAFAVFVKDPLKYIAKEPVASGRPRGCRHDPPCVDDAAHTMLDLAERRRVS